MSLAYQLDHSTSGAPQVNPNDKNSLIAYARYAAQKAGVNPDIFVAQINQESGFNPRAGSSAGALGIAQIVPKWHPGVDPMDPQASLDYAANLMASHLQSYNGNYALALAAYNAGPGAVAQYNGVPPFQETRNYVSSIMSASGQSNVSGKMSSLMPPWATSSGGTEGPGTRPPENNPPPYPGQAPPQYIFSPVYGGAGGAASATSQPNPAYAKWQQDMNAYMEWAGKQKDTTPGSTPSDSFRPYTPGSGTTGTDTGGKIPVSHVDLGDHTRTYFDDGTFEDLPKGATPGENAQTALGNKQLGQNQQQFDTTSAFTTAVQKWKEATDARDYTSAEHWKQVAADLQNAQFNEQKYTDAATVAQRQNQMSLDYTKMLTSLSGPQDWVKYWNASRGQTNANGGTSIPYSQAIPAWAQPVGMPQQPGALPTNSIATASSVPNTPSPSGTVTTAGVPVPIPSPRGTVQTQGEAGPAWQGVGTSNLSPQNIALSGAGANAPVVGGNTKWGGPGSGPPVTASTPNPNPGQPFFSDPLQSAAWVAAHPPSAQEQALRERNSDAGYRASRGWAAAA